MTASTSSTPQKEGSSQVHTQVSIVSITMEDQNHQDDSIRAALIFDTFDSQRVSRMHFLSSPDRIDWLSFVARCEPNRVAFQLHLQHCGWYDSRLFSLQMLSCYRDLTLGDQDRRTQHASHVTAILEKLAKPSSNERLLRCFTHCSLTEISAARILTCILRNYICCLAKKSHSCLLLQKLFEKASLESKWVMMREVLPRLITLSKHKRANYLVSMMLHYLVRSTDKRSGEVLSNIQHTVFGGDGSIFVDLATNKFGSFVLERVIESCTSERCMAFTQLLKQSGHFGQLQEHAHAKHCIRCLCEC